MSYSIIYFQKGNGNIQREGMETLSSICKKEGGYLEVIKESYLVKNAVILLGGGGRRRGRGGRDYDGGGCTISV